MILRILNSKIITTIILIFLFINFANSQTSSSQDTILTIGDIPVPEEYTRIFSEKVSFADWIRRLPLKPPNSPVQDFRNNIFKSKDDTTVAAVINWSINGKRLEQCMDILVRFYAEYLWEKQKQEKLRLPLPGNKLLYWQDWQKGYRPKFKGINYEFIKSEKYNSSKTNYEKYLNLIFA